MQIALVILAALVPVAVVLWYIIRKDKAKPEPSKWLWKAFWFGILSALIALAVLIPVSLVFGLDTDAETYPSILSAFADAFFEAAIPEELAKFLMLWLLLRKNPFFDEKFDGIVYAVCIGMGFAGLENVLYLFDGLEDGSWISTGISRALFAIPGHFLFAVMMGYYYSIWHFGIDRSTKAKIMILLAPILAHGLYDGIIMSMHVNEILSVAGMFVFLFFLSKLRKKGTEKINELMNQ